MLPLTANPVPAPMPAQDKISACLKAIGSSKHHPGWSLGGLFVMMLPVIILAGCIGIAVAREPSIIPSVVNGLVSLVPKAPAPALTSAVTTPPATTLASTP